MKIWDFLAFQVHLVCVSKLWIIPVKIYPLRSLVPTIVKHSSQYHDIWPFEVVCNIAGVAFLVINVQMELLQVCGPFLMAIVL